MKNWIIILLVVVVLGGLYFIETSKINTDNADNSLPTLDDIQPNKVARNWDLFYKVRATLIDGQTADLTIPDELRKLEGEEMELAGGVLFTGTGYQQEGDSSRLDFFYLLPTLGLAEACVLQPDEAMRWTIGINLSETWTVHRTDMIGAQATVKGKFRIDNSKPYESVFFIDDAQLVLLKKE